MLPVLTCFGFLFYILHDTQLHLPEEIFTEETQAGIGDEKGTELGECLANRSNVREQLENKGEHLMKGFTCSILKGDMVIFQHVCCP